MSTSVVPTGPIVTPVATPVTTTAATTAATTGATPVTPIAATTEPPPPPSPPTVKKLVGIKSLAIKKPAVEALKGVVDILNQQIIPGVDSFIKTDYQTIGIYNLNNGKDTKNIIVPLPFSIPPSLLTNINTDGKGIIAPSNDSVITTDETPLVEDVEEPVPKGNGQSVQTVDPVLKKNGKQKKENAQQPVAQPAALQVAQPVAQPAALQVAQPAPQPVAQPAAQPATQGKPQPAPQPATQGKPQPAAQGKPQPAAQPAPQPAAQPVAIKKAGKIMDIASNFSLINPLFLSSMVSGGKKIGEGTYGCVHEPSLICSDNETPGPHTISKLLNKKDAETEIAQYEAIHAIDPKNQFYLGVPIMCDAAETESNKTEIEQCLKTQSNTTLLRMVNGGIDLFRYCKRGILDGKFWCEFHRTIKGIQLFNQNGYIHYDIKPDNILYDETLNRINFIDFGLMQKKLNIYNKGIQNRHHISYHPTYSLEHFFYNKTNYETVLLGSIEDKQRFINNFRKLAETSNDKEQISENQMIQKVRTSLATLFRWIGRVDFCQRMVRDYATFVMLEREQNGFLQFIVAATNKFDIYGLGLTMIYLLNHWKEPATHPAREPLYELAYNMINPNIYERYDIETVSDNYVNIMMEHYFKSVPKIKTILKSHEIPPFNVTSGGGGDGTASSTHPVVVSVDETPIHLRTTVKKHIDNPVFLTRRRKFKIHNIAFHSKISKKRSEKYRFSKNKKRKVRRKTPPL
jgi:serine/threonine protein kinase